MDSKINKFNNEQRDRVIKEIFKKFNAHDGKFDERSKIILSSNDDKLIKDYLEKFFSDSKFWFRDINENTVNLIRVCADKYRRETVYDLQREFIFVALNSSRNFKEFFDKNNVHSAQMAIYFFEKVMAELDVILKSNKNDVGVLFKVEMVKFRFKDALKTVNPIVQAGLLNSGLIDKIEVINRCLNFANQNFTNNRSGLRAFELNSISDANECLETLFKKLTENETDKQKNLNYIADYNNNDNWLQFVIASLKQDFRRENVEAFLRKYDLENYKDYFRFASSLVLSNELENVKTKAKKQCRKVESDELQYLLPRVCELLKWSDFDASTFDFAEFDTENLDLYVKSATQAMDYYTHLSTGNKIICNLVKLSSQNERQDLVDLLRERYVKSSGLKKEMSFDDLMIIAENDPENVSEWIKKEPVCGESSAKSFYKFVKTIYNADPQYAEIQLADIYKKIEKSHCPNLKLYIALMSDDALMLKEIAQTVISSEVSADLAKMCKNFAKLAEEDVRQVANVLVVDGNDELLPQTQERLSQARNVALDTAYEMFKNRAKILKTQKENNNGDIEELLSRIK